MALTKVSRGLLSTGIVDNSNATAITLNADESATFAGAISVTGTATMGGLTLDGNNSYTSNIKFDYGASAPTYFSNWGYKSSSDGNKVFLTMTDGGAAKDVLVANYNGNVGIGGVGNISPYGIRFAINGTGSGGAGLYFGSGVILPTDNTPTISDANVDLGASNYRFKDLHLSGAASMTGLSPGIVTISSGSYFIGNTASGYRFNNAADTVNLMILKDNGDLSVGTSGTGHRLFVADPVNATQGTAQFRILGYGYSAFHFLDANAYHIGQNSQGRYLRMYSGGNTGVGVSLSPQSTSWGTYSDERLKENIEPIENALTSLSRLRTVKYHLKDVDSAESKKRLGLIAQDLVGVLDEVTESITRAEDDTEYMAVRYTEIIPVLVKAIQEQQATIEALTHRIETLENN